VKFGKTIVIFLSFSHFFDLLYLLILGVEGYCCTWSY